MSSRQLPTSSALKPYSLSTVSVAESLQLHTLNMNLTLDHSGRRNSVFTNKFGTSSLHQIYSTNGFSQYYYCTWSHYTNDIHDTDVRYHIRHGPQYTQVHTHLKWKPWNMYATLHVHFDLFVKNWRFCGPAFQLILRKLPFMYTVNNDDRYLQQYRLAFRTQFCKCHCTEFIYLHIISEHTSTACFFTYEPRVGFYAV